MLEGAWDLISFEKRKVITSLDSLALLLSIHVEFNEVCVGLILQTTQVSVDGSPASKHVNFSLHCGVCMCSSSPDIDEDQLIKRKDPRIDFCNPLAISLKVESDPLNTALQVWSFNQFVTHLAVQKPGYERRHGKSLTLVAINYVHGYFSLTWLFILP